MLFWLPCALLCGATACTVEADEARLDLHRAADEADSAALLPVLEDHAMAQPVPCHRRSSSRPPSDTSPPA